MTATGHRAPSGRCSLLARLVLAMRPGPLAVAAAALPVAVRRWRRRSWTFEVGLYWQ
jgi:hypothetical protein